MKANAVSRGGQAGLALAALGVVYGDIGTSPLYALRECFSGPHAVAPAPAHVLGVLSLIIWSLLAIVSLKYLGLVLRADNRGEGGILALMSLAAPDRAAASRTARWLLGLGIFGAGLLYGDGMLTPSLTVLSAVEGLEVATPVFAPHIRPIAAAILVGLFAVQRYGTGRVGRAFGPVMVVWFGTLAVLGGYGLSRAPEVLRAFDPSLGLSFLAQNGWHGFAVLGSVFLVVTGAEALYADMGHFGASAIRRAWFYGALPALLLNYLGQGALILSDPAAAENPFYRLAPGWAQFPLVALATAAAVIASQALISGVFSITMQAVQLGFLPRLAVHHTSSEQRGQIYVPLANWLLLGSCVALVLGFGSSSRLAAAYGIAVTLTMLITTLLLGFVARQRWGWSRWGTGLFFGAFLGLELAYFGSNVLKIGQGGWAPLILGAALVALMATWQKGRTLLRARLKGATLPIDLLLADLEKAKYCRVPGTAVFMSGDPRGTPLALLHNLKHNGVIHERTVLLTILTAETPYVEKDQRVTVEKLPHGFYRVTARCGFMERPAVPGLLRRCADQGLKFELERTTFFLSRETLVPARKPGMARWRRGLFTLLARNAQQATAYFSLPPSRVVELGMQVEL